MQGWQKPTKQTYLLERGQQLEADKAHLVAPDVFEQKGVVLQVLV